MGRGQAAVWAVIDRYPSRVWTPGAHLLAQEEVLHNLGGRANGDGWPSGVDFDSAGSLYGTNRSRRR
jgi:hypothetical protein